MFHIKDFNETDHDFTEICRIENLINIDSISHPDEKKDHWEIRNKSRYYDKILAYNDDSLVGLINLAQGEGSNDRNFYFSIYIDPTYNGKGVRRLLYKELLKRTQKFNCIALYPSIYDHPNYNQDKKFFLDNGFKLVQKNREYSLKLEGCDTAPYESLLEKLDGEGIKILESVVELNKDPSHYRKLEELEWIYDQDMPMPDGIQHYRTPFDEWMKDIKHFEDKYYGIELVAIKNQMYIGSTDIEVMKKSDPYKAWTGGLGVHPDYRRKGVATALKVVAINKLRERGIKEIRTDNEENNPMYKINVALGFQPVPFRLDYKKKLV